MDLGWKPPSESLSDMNFTPLVDIMLVLMIIFMITSPLDPAGVELDLPEADAARIPRKDQVLTVYMNVKNEIVISNQDGKVVKTSPGHVREALRSFPQAHEANVKGDKNLPYQDVMSLLVELKGAGIKKLGLLTQKPQGTEDSSNAIGGSADNSTGGSR